MKWTPVQQGETAPNVGYRITFESKRAISNQHVNGATVYVSHNKFMRDGQHFIYDPRAVSSLASGDSATVFWSVTVVQAAGGFDDQGNPIGAVTACGAASPTWTIQLIV